jgi:hypothetical protein
MVDIENQIINFAKYFYQKIKTQNEITYILDFYTRILESNLYKRQMEPIISIEIKDNAFSRQFEAMTHKGLVSVEYSFQDKKIFLTKINAPDSFDDEEFISNFLKNIMELSIEKKLKVVPILPKIVVFFKKNPIYKELLPPGIRL